MKPHPDVKQLKKLFPAVRKYQKLAMKHGIPDIFQDNGGKILQVCLILGLIVLKAREGNDAVDADGNEYELKTVNLLRTDQFTTHHHLNPVIIAKYRKVDWIFSTYEAIELKEIFLLKPNAMEYWYQKWKGNGKRTEVRTSIIPRSLSLMCKNMERCFIQVLVKTLKTRSCP